MVTKIKNLNDLMNLTYSGRYAPQFLRMNQANMAGIKPLGGLPQQADLMKADDPLLTTDTAYYGVVIGRTTFDWLNHESDIWKLIRKTTFQQKGDSIRVVTADANNFYGQNELYGAFGDTDIPDLSKITFTKPAVMYHPWEVSLIAQLQSLWQDSPDQNAGQFLKNHFMKKHPSDINAKLCLDTDTPAAPGGNLDNFLESIDRICSNAAESALLSDAGDNDIYGLDRSASEGEAYVDLGGGALRDLQLGFIDDMIADCKKYSMGRNFIMITDETQLNTIESLEETKHRYTDGKWKISNVNGVNTREGREIGFSVASYRGAGIEVPIFTSKDIHAESGGNGNIYLLDMDHIEIRVALPTVYLSTENQQFPVLESFNYKSVLLTVAQLCATKFNVHGAIKYLN